MKPDSIATKPLTVRDAISKIAAIKSIKYYERLIARIDEGDSGGNRPPQLGDSAESDNPSDPIHAAILPLPPHLTHLVEDATLGMIFVVNGHHVPPHLRGFEVAGLPSRSRDIRKIFAGAKTLTFEGFVMRSGKIETRRDIVDLLADLADSEIRPKLFVHPMFDRPHHEEFEVIEDEWLWEEI